MNLPRHTEGRWQRIIEEHTDEWDDVGEEWDPAAVLQRVYGPMGADEMLFYHRDTDADASMDDGFYALHDLNGNVVMLLDHAGALMEKYHYSPYATVRAVPYIAGDIDEDGTVTSLDSGAFNPAFGKVMGTDAAYDARADFDRDGVVSVFDFGTFSTNFGNSAPGLPAGAISAFGNTIGYAGYVWEPNLGGGDAGGAGMYQVRFRWYVPELGRFASADPLGYFDSLNHFEYVAGSPLALVDPLGLFVAQTHGISVSWDWRGFWEGASDGALVTDLSFLDAATGFAFNLSDLPYIYGWLFNPCDTALQWSMQAGRISVWALEAAGLAKALYNAAKAGIKAIARAIRRGCPCFVAGTMVLTADGAVPIEQLDVGDRVLSGETAPSAEEPTIEPEQWRVLNLTMTTYGEETDIVELRCLRPIEWINECGAKAGAVIAFALPELDISGSARIDSIEPCPEIAAGPGHVVLSTLSHIDSEVCRVWFEGSEEPLEPTPNHRLYSETRADWVAAGDLRPGEHLKTRDGLAVVHRGGQYDTVE